jgi:hypothetical protein
LGAIALRRLAAGFSLLLAVGTAGCLIPNRGTPVFVDARAGDFWSGKGMLLEVSEDRLRCRVRIRDRALIARDRWVDCRSVHPR